MEDNMRKLLCFFVVFSMILPISLFAAGASTYKYDLQIVDEYDQPIESGAYLYVHDAGTVTQSTIWPSDDTTTGTLTGAVTVDSDGGARFYGTGTSYDIDVSYGGQHYFVKALTPGGQRRIKVRRIQDNTGSLDERAVTYTANRRLTLTIGGNFFIVRGTAGIGIVEIAETGHTVGERVLLLFENDTQIKPSSTGTNIVVSQCRTGTNGRPNSTMYVGSGTMVEIVYDGTKWILLSPMAT